MMETLTRLAATCILVASTTAGHAQDHPLLGHLEGATPEGFFEVEFDEARLIAGPMAESTSRDQQGAGWETFEGKITYVYHRLPDGLSSLAALRSYEKALKEKGFVTQFVCDTTSGSCFDDGRSRPGLILGMALDGRVDMPRLDAPDLIRNLFYNGNGRYFLGRLDRPEGAVYASLAFSDDESVGRHMIARVVETGDLQATGLAYTEASELSQKLDADGKVDIYGILFDFDKADIKPESAPQLQAIADLLAEKPDLRLMVSGHTDNQGSADYNRNLSERRANAVIAALQASYGVAGNRLAARGLGFSEPVASNDDDAGRALNRRVELGKMD